jgi:hypothetical protein
VYDELMADFNVDFNLLLLQQLERKLEKYNVLEKIVKVTSQQLEQQEIINQKMEQLTKEYEQIQKDNVFAQMDKVLSQLRQKIEQMTKEQKNKQEDLNEKLKEYIDKKLNEMWDRWEDSYQSGVVVKYKSL